MSKPTTIKSTSPLPPPRPSTPGVGPTILSNTNTSRSNAILNSKVMKFGGTAWAWKKTILFGLGTTVGLYNYQVQKLKALERDQIHDDSYILWKIYPGAIVEAKSTGSTLNYLLNSSQGGSPDEPPRVQTLFEVIRTIKFIEADDRIRGMVADFSTISVPSVPSYSLGLAQIEEIQDALLQLRKTKREKFGSNGWRSVAWTDSFASQGDYLFASAFDEIYTQPTGGVPLVGISSTTPFFGRLAKWLGIEVHAEARNEYKSFVQPYIDEKFTNPQRENKEEIMNDLNDNLMTYIARNRFENIPGRSGLDHVKTLSLSGPYTGKQAVSVGLLNGTNYRQDVLDSVLETSKGGDPNRKLKGFYHYSKVIQKAVESSNENVIVDVGVVYLMGAIGETGEFGTAAVVRGLKEAGEDPSIGAVVLRIDSGGGGVVESDTIWGAVRDLREKYGKTVIASFGNASASGGYLVSTHVDGILAAPSTITGSIGVASLRPTILTSFFDRLHLTIDSSYTGSRVLDPTHRLTSAEKKRSSDQVDEMYDDFKNRVCEGRGIHKEVIDLIAGGRVMTGLTAFGLHAPAELIREIKGLDPVSTLPTISTILAEPEVTSITSSQDSSSIPTLNTVAIISEDQETSPFAPPTSIETLIPTTEIVPPVPSTSTEFVSSEERGSILNGVAGSYEVVAGPFGRGLIDGLGGIRDSAVYACELYLSKGIAKLKEENPLITEEDAIRSLLPDAVIAKGNEGQMRMQMDVNLKRFPVQKNFLTQLAESTKRGDSMEISALTQYLKASAATWFLKLAVGIVSTEMEELGLTNSKGLGISSIGSKNNSILRAELHGFNLK